MFVFFSLDDIYVGMYIDGTLFVSSGSFLWCFLQQILLLARNFEHLRTQNILKKHRQIVGLKPLQKMVNWDA